MIIMKTTLALLICSVHVACAFKYNVFYYATEKADKTNPASTRGVGAIDVPSDIAVHRSSTSWRILPGYVQMSSTGMANDKTRSFAFGRVFEYDYKGSPVKLIKGIAVNDGGRVSVPGGAGVIAFEFGRSVPQEMADAILNNAFQGEEWKDYSRPPHKEKGFDTYIIESKLYRPSARIADPFDLMKKAESLDKEREKLEVQAQGLEKAGNKADAGKKRTLAKAKKDAAFKMRSDVMASTKKINAILTDLRDPKVTHDEFRRRHGLVELKGARVGKRHASALTV